MTVVFLRPFLPRSVRRTAYMRYFVGCVAFWRVSPAANRKRHKPPIPSRTGNGTARAVLRSRQGEFKSFCRPRRVPDSRPRACRVFFSELVLRSVRVKKKPYNPPRESPFPVVSATDAGVSLPRRTIIIFNIIIIIIHVFVVFEKRNGIGRIV